MTSPKLASDTDHGRMYARTEGGTLEVPSITTIIGQQATDLSGWHGYMAAKAALEDRRSYRVSQSSGLKFAIIRDAAQASERYRDEAAARGDRVHNYAENVALAKMGKEHRAEECREILVSNGEQAYADRFDEWWDIYNPRPLATEVTIWNHSVGYAGTLDLVAEIAGHVCIIDYKTKGTDRKGRVKALDPKVVMQLVAGLKAEEYISDETDNLWKPWEYSKAPILMGVALGQTQVVPQQANPVILEKNWYRFCALKRVWDCTRDLAENGAEALMPVVPPPATPTTTPITHLG
ncbi:cytochrome [Rothia sp. P7181]|uniref:cytochrome n=1 Tax=unclassified Rothia (in: high G+C Gram-positive bacteria) TaxID=2689056 RepID=UPI003AD2E94D